MLLLYSRSFALPLSLMSTLCLVSLQVSKTLSPSSVFADDLASYFTERIEGQKKNSKDYFYYLYPLTSISSDSFVPSTCYLLCEKHLCSYLKVILQFMNCPFSICRNITPEIIPSPLCIVSCLLYIRSC